MEEKKGFLGILFDLNFTEFLTPKIIKLLFILGIVSSAISVFFVIVAGFRQGQGILYLLASPVIFVFSVIGIRIWLELIMLGFKIANNTTAIVNKLEQKKED